MERKSILTLVILGGIIWLMGKKRVGELVGMKEIEKPEIQPQLSVSQKEMIKEFVYTISQNGYDNYNILARKYNLTIIQVVPESWYGIRIILKGKPEDISSFHEEAREVRQVLFYRYPLYLSRRK